MFHKCKTDFHSIKNIFHHSLSKMYCLDARSRYNKTMYMRENNKNDLKFRKLKLSINSSMTKQKCDA